MKSNGLCCSVSFKNHLSDRYADVKQTGFDLKFGPWYYNYYSITYKVVLSVLTRVKIMIKI